MRLSERQDGFPLGGSRTVGILVPPVRHSDVMYAITSAIHDAASSPSSQNQRLIAL